MGADEISTRLGQAWHQRIDAASWRAGIAPVAPKADAGVPRGAFFFDSGAAPRIAAAWRARCPEEAEAAILRARQIERRRFPLLGFDALEFGNPIDWQLDPVHGKRAPLKPFPSVPYLDFDTAGDHKIVWELGRHQHLVTLARGWLLSGGDSLASQAIAQWGEWRNANPYPLGMHWASALEVAFRALSWIWLDHLLETFPGTDAFRAGLLPAIGHSAWYIERYLSTYFAPNTHLLGEAYALFAIGAVYPMFRDAARWRDTGWKIVLEQSKAQVHAGGFHFEQSVYYHVYALDFFLHARILAARNGVDIPAAFDATIGRMADALAAIAQGGCPPRFGDDDGGRLFDPARNRAEHMLDPLAVAAGVLGRGVWPSAPTEEAFWLGGGVFIDDASRDGALRPPPRSAAFPDSGYYVLASPSHGVAIADAGPHGWGNAGHGHADALSVQWIQDGKAVLSDPGAGAYPQALPLRDQLRGTAAHNTLTVDGLSQAEPVNSFAWRAHPCATIHVWRLGSGCDVLCASHDGYTRLPDPVTHRRWIVRWGGAFLVRDLVEGSGSHELALHWHFAPGADPARLAVAGGTGWESAVIAASYSPAYGIVETAPCVAVRRHARLTPAEPVETAAAFGDASDLVMLSPGYYRWSPRAAAGFDARQETTVARFSGSAVEIASFDASGEMAAAAAADAASLTEWRQGETLPPTIDAAGLRRLFETRR